MGTYLFQWRSFSSPGFTHKAEIVGSGGSVTGAWAYGRNTGATWAGDALNTAVWESSFSNYSFEAGKWYRAEVGNFYLYLPRAVMLLGLKSEALFILGVMDGAGQTVASQEWGFGALTVPHVDRWGSHIGWRWNTAENEDFSFRFNVPSDISSQDLNDYKFVVQVAIKAIGSVGSQLPDGASEGLPWVAFEGVRVVEEESDDSRWQNEQRGFWERLWTFLTGMWDAITDIPAKIGAFFTNLINKLGDWFAQLGQWFTDMVNAIGDWFTQLGEWFVELGDKISQWFQDLKDFFINLFIPEEGAIQEKVDDFMAYAETKLGFVMQIDDLVRAVIQPIVNGGDGGDVILTLPRAALPASFGGAQLWAATGFNLSAVVRENSSIGVVYSIYKVLASVLLLGLLLRYLYRVASDILGEKDGGEKE